jgi:halogenation protein CepH
MIEERCDAIVLGGGPGGSTSASVIAKAGHKVLLVEKERFPRYSIGESLLPATIHGICQMLGLKDELEKAGFTLKRGGTFRWGKGKDPWTFTFDEASVNRHLDFHYAYQVQRSRFDQILLDNARRLGVVVHEESEAQEILFTGDRATGVRWRSADGQERVTHASHVLDATGHRGNFHKMVGRRVFSRYFQNVALFAYFRGGKRMPKPNDGNILCVAFEHGWFWYIPLSPEITSVGAVVDKQYGKRISEEGYEASLERFVAACPMIQDMMASATRITEGELGQIRLRTDYSYCNDRFWRPGLALVGDSACFIDPVFSSGVHLATYSGLMAARAVNASLMSPSDEAVWFDAFETRYLKEYRAFYEFLVSFYEMGASEDSYFWKAREVLKSEEAANEAFVRLVAGAGTTSEDFLEMRQGLGSYMQSLINVQAETNLPPSVREQAKAEVAREQAGARGTFLAHMEDGLTWSTDLKEPSQLERAVDDGIRASRDGLLWERAR